MIITPIGAVCVYLKSIQDQHCFLILKRSKMINYMVGGYGSINKAQQ